MATGCNQEPTEEIDQMLDEAANGLPQLFEKNWGEIEENKPLIEEAKKGVEEFEKNIEKIIPPYATSILNRPEVEIRILPESIPAEIKTSKVAEKIQSFNPKDFLLIEEKSNFRDIVSENKKDYPEDIPKVEETNALAKRVPITIENLIRMRNGTAPCDENDKPIELHHFQQKAERLIQMKMNEHRGKGLKGLLHGFEPLTKEERNVYKNQRAIYWRWKAEKYLPEYLKEAFDQLEIRNGEIVKKLEHY